MTSARYQLSEGRRFQVTGGGTGLGRAMTGLFLRFGAEENGGPLVSDGCDWTDDVWRQARERIGSQNAKVCAQRWVTVCDARPEQGLDRNPEAAA